MSDELLSIVECGIFDHSEKTSQEAMHLGM